MLLPTNILEFSKFARHLAEQAAKVIRPHFRKPIQITLKQDTSPVTLADKNGEAVMRDLIHKQYPDHGIIGEEFGNENETAEFVWVLDPVDGTKSFISGALSFGTLIGLLFQGQPLLGVYYHPVLKDLLLGDNRHTTLNGKNVRIRQTDSLDTATLLATDHTHFDRFDNGEPFNALVRNVGLYRNWGDCYGYFLLCSGYADIMLDAKMNLWDIAALIPLVRGAGGIITDLFGDDPLKGDSIIACGRSLHPLVLKELQPSYKELLP
jgi:histidinol phosphatase-like enzyme (inositol monophosphatase family)